MEVMLPQLFDDTGDPAPDLPTALTTARPSLAATTNEIAAQADVISKDGRWSEAERGRLLSELCESALPEVARAAEIAAAVQALADESRAGALRKALGYFE